MKRLSLALVLVAIALAIGWYWSVSQYENPIAADIPADLTTGKAYSITVTPGFSSNYALEVAFARRLNIHVFACLAGGLNEDAVRESNCGALSPTLSLAWATSAHGVPIAHGISREPLGFVTNSDKIISTIAVFKLQKGSSYIVNAKILSDAGPLATLSPHIMIVATTDYAEGLGLFTDIVLLAIIVLLAAAVLAYVIGRRRAAA